MVRPIVLKIPWEENHYVRDVHCVQSRMVRVVHLFQEMEPPRQTVTRIPPLHPQMTEVRIFLLKNVIILIKIPQLGDFYFNSSIKPQ